MSHYKSNVRDQVFNLFEVLGVDKTLGQGDYSDIDAETAQEMLNEISRLAEGPVAASFVVIERLLVWGCGSGPRRTTTRSPAASPGHRQRAVRSGSASRSRGPARR